MGSDRWPSARCRRVRAAAVSWTMMSVVQGVVWSLLGLLLTKAYLLIGRTTRATVHSAGVARHSRRSRWPATPTPLRRCGRACGCEAAPPLLSPDVGSLQGVDGPRGPMSAASARGGEMRSQDVP